jgi:peptide/nickel transport system permease protein
MATYILRRLLLMIPTLIGITFLVFMIIALAPGGIGAALRQSGGQMEANSAAMREAYLEDRYGLDDSAPVQYIRWLGRVSPIKFGVRDQIDPTGEFIRSPKLPKEPPLWDWFADSLPEYPASEGYEFSPDDDQQRRARLFRRQNNAYAQARAGAIGAKANLDQLLGFTAGEAEIRKFRDSKGKIKYDVIEQNKAAFENSDSWDQILAAGNALITNYELAQREWVLLKDVFDAKPFPEAGFGIVGGVSISSPDLGRSFTKSRPVVDLIKDALPITIMLNLIAVPIIYFIAIPCGMLAAVKSGSLFDRLSGAFFIGLWSFPIPLAGVLCIGYLASNDYLGWFPVAGLHDANSDTFTYLPTTGENGWEPGYLLDLAWHVCLPVLCLVYGGFAVLSKQTRAAMLDNFNMDYVRTAKAKGVANHNIIFAHVFRNSLLPLITMFVSIFPAMLAGSVVIEQIFTVPGMGRLTLESINLRDRELLLANTMMISAVNLLALLLADILYAFADPRISFK